MSAYLCEHCGIEPPDYIGAQCPRCGLEYVAAWVYEQLAAELRWCDAERRLALRALGDMRECIRWHDEVRAVVDKATRWGAAVMRAQAAQIAAADEEEVER